MVDTTLSDQPFQDKTVLTDDRLVFLENEYTQTQKTNLAEIYEYYGDKNAFFPYLGQIDASTTSPNTLLDKSGWYDVITNSGAPVAGWPVDLPTAGAIIETIYKQATSNVSFAQNISATTAVGLKKWARTKNFSQPSVGPWVPDHPIYTETSTSTIKARVVEYPDGKIEQFYQIGNGLPASSFISYEISMAGYSVVLIGTSTARGDGVQYSSNISNFTNNSGFQYYSDSALGSGIWLGVSFSGIKI